MGNKLGKMFLRLTRGFRIVNLLERGQMIPARGKCGRSGTQKMVSAKQTTSPAEMPRCINLQT